MGVYIKCLEMPKTPLFVCIYPNGICSDEEGMIYKAVPAADLRPVVRARWLTGSDNPRTYGRIRAMCGRCGAFALAEMVNAGSYKEQLSNFCPNCGARMEEK